MNKWGRRFLSICLLLMANPTRADLLTVPLPATLNQRDIGELNARVNDSQIVSLDLRPIRAKLEQILPAEQYVKLRADNAGWSLPSQLESAGVHVVFDYQNLTLQLTLPPDQRRTETLTGGGFSSSTSQTLNFGQLANAQVKNCDLLIKKNTACTVAFTSANLGVLKMIPTPTTDQVAYAFRVNGTLLNLSGPANVSLPTGVSPAPDGTRLPILVTMGDPAGATAGNYQDQITITVTAL